MSRGCAYYLRTTTSMLAPSQLKPGSLQKSLAISNENSRDLGLGASVDPSLVDTCGLKKQKKKRGRSRGAKC